jgi:hypothetical protein
MVNLKKLAVVIAFFTFASVANGTIITSIEDATNGGGFFAEVTYENNGANTVRVTADISDRINLGISKGDILGMWFDLGNFNTLSGVPNFGGPTEVLDFDYAENSVGSSLSKNVNINGSSATDWDLAVNVGKNGSRGGFNQTLSFDITIAGLNESLFYGTRVGMRVQSIKGSSFKSGSSKLVGVSPSALPSTSSLTRFNVEPLRLLNRNSVELPELGRSSVEVAEPGLILIYGLAFLAIGLRRSKRPV